MTAFSQMNNHGCAHHNHNLSVNKNQTLTSGLSFYEPLKRDPSNKRWLEYICNHEYYRG